MMAPLIDQEGGGQSFLGMEAEVHFLKMLIGGCYIHMLVRQVLSSTSQILGSSSKNTQLKYRKRGTAGKGKWECRRVGAKT